MNSQANDTTAERPFPMGLVLLPACVGAIVWISTIVARLSY
jgi:hypothetical protein